MEKTIKRPFKIYVYNQNDCKHILNIIKKNFQDNRWNWEEEWEEENDKGEKIKKSYVFMPYDSESYPLAIKDFGVLKNNIEEYNVIFYDIEPFKMDESEKYNNYVFYKNQIYNITIKQNKKNKNYIEILDKKNGDIYIGKTIEETIKKLLLN